VLIIMKTDHRPEDLEAIIQRVKKDGCEPYMLGRSEDSSRRERRDRFAGGDRSAGSQEPGNGE